MWNVIPAVRTGCNAVKPIACRAFARVVAQRSAFCAPAARTEQLLACSWSAPSQCIVAGVRCMHVSAYARTGQSVAPPRDAGDRDAVAHTTADAAEAAARSWRDDKRVRVFASYVGTRIDVARLSGRAKEAWKLPDSAVKLEKDWVMLRVPFSDFNATGSADAHTYVSASRRGAVVVVNAHTRRPPTGARVQLEPLLQDRSVCPAPLSLELHEDLCLVLDPLAATTTRTPAQRPSPRTGADAAAASVGGASPAASAAAPPGSTLDARASDVRSDMIVPLGELDGDAVRLLNGVMAQTVNLQHFEMQVDRMYELVTDIFKTLERTGEGTGEQGWAARVRLGETHRRGITSKELYRHLGAASSIANAIMLSNMRTSIRPGSTAWNDERYASLHEELWSEFELEDRYEELERRVAYITETIKYALEVARDAHTIHLERLIVMLITAELLISIASAGVVPQILDAAASLLR